MKSSFVKVTRQGTFVITLEDSFSWYTITIEDEYGTKMQFGTAHIADAIYVADYIKDTKVIDTEELLKREFRYV